MCSTYIDIWWPARAHQQDRDKLLTELLLFTQSKPEVFNFVQNYLHCLITNNYLTVFQFFKVNAVWQQCRKYRNNDDTLHKAFIYNALFHK